MKKLIFILILTSSLCVNAQRNYYRQQPPPTYTDDKQPLSDNRWYIGSGLTIGGVFGNYGSFALGANPEVGYSVSQLLDVGMSFNLNYYTYSDIDGFGTKQRSFNYGLGVYARLHVFEGFFFQVLPEYNWIDTKVIYNSGNTAKFSQGATSLLLGVGFGRRFIGESSFYTSIMIDAGTEINSPYKNYDGSILPVFRTGFNFYLHKKKK